MNSKRNHVCPGGLSVVGPDNRMTMAGMKNFLGEMQKTARRISGKLITVNKNRIIENERQTLN
jgi:DNA-binding IclR family transcriptional regulator